jgi:hypothetical protein
MCIKRCKLTIITDIRCAEEEKEESWVITQIQVLLRGQRGRA